jgi:hypothetical protein
MWEVANIFAINKILYQEDTTECARVLKALKALGYIQLISSSETQIIKRN